MFLSILEFVGHFHPLLVHLPIGILLIAIFLQWLSGRESYRSYAFVVPVILLMGVIAAFLSCITGWLLSLTDDYDHDLVGWHMWMGISVAFVSLLLYAKTLNPRFGINRKLLTLLLLTLILVTGHLGGSLTHGSDYLTKPLTDIFGKDTIANAVIKPLPNVQEAYAYSDVVLPVLQTKCYSCHGKNKQKGKLRMDDSLLLMKGGKDGKVILTGNAKESDLIKRLLLPVDNEDHMPPKEKPQPSENQIALLEWWISQGALFGKKVKEVAQSEKIVPVLFALQKTIVTEKEGFDIPAGSVEKADASVLDKMKALGIVALPVAQNSNYLQANFITDSLISNEELQLLLAVKKQLIWLKLGNTNISDGAMTMIGQLTNLTRLNLEHTPISDNGLHALQSLSHLQYLNLVGTIVTQQGILQLRNLKSLHSLYLYHTKVNRSDWGSIQNAFPKTNIDSGEYAVPTLITDTTLVKTNKDGYK
ncbi:MAG TPA: c-type cytochrome domain-containing protein [Puia sp.]